MDMTEATQELDSVAGLEVTAAGEFTEATAEGDAKPKKEKEPRGNRWHAVLSDGSTVSVEHKNDLKKALRDRPAAQIVTVIRGKVIPLASKVTF